MDGMNDKLDALWVEYRDACPDPEPSAGFMPRMWQRIEARRVAMTFTLPPRWCRLGAGHGGLAIVLGAVVIPRSAEAAAGIRRHYVDVLAADHPNTYVDILNGDIK